MVSTRPRKLNFNREIGKRYVWMAFPGNPKMCFVITGCCIHNTSIKYKSYTGQFLAQTQHSNYCIFTLVNREKLFLDSTARGCTLPVGFFLFCFFQKTRKSYDSYAQTYTHGHTHTYKQRHKSLWPPSLPPSPAVLDQAFFLHLQNTEKWLWSHVALFFILAFSFLSPRTPLRRQLHSDKLF